MTRSDGPATAMRAYERQAKKFHDDRESRRELKQLGELKTGPEGTGRRRRLTACRRNARTTGSLWSPPSLPGAKPGGAAPDTDVDPAAERRKRIARELRDSEYELRRRRQVVEVEMARLEANFGTTEANKYRQRIVLLREEVVLIDQEIEKLRARLEVEKGAEVRDNLTQSIRGLESDQHGGQNQLTRAEDAPDPYSMRDQMPNTVTELENRIGIAAESVARASRTSSARP